MIAYSIVGREHGSVELETKKLYAVRYAAVVVHMYRTYRTIHIYVQHIFYFTSYSLNEYEYVI